MLKRFALVCFVAVTSLPALRSEAATIATRLGVYNNSPKSFTTTVTVKDDSDWQEQRPDDNFNSRSLGPLSGSVQPEDLNSGGGTALFEMTIAFEDGDVVSFTADQRNAAKLKQYEARKLALSGPSASRYIASQVVLPNKTLAISVTPRQNLSKWMAPVSDETLISQLTIPGTHDSGSLHEDKTSFGFAKTQDSNLTEQLRLGVRFFDIRLNKDLKVFHGRVDQHLTFADVIRTCVAFLRRNRKETILMSINASEPKENAKTPTPFARAVYNAILTGKTFWALGEQIPKLGDVREKIVLLRRYPAGSAPEIGIDVSDWPDDTRYATRTNPAGVTYAIQDHWKCCASSVGKTHKRDEILAQIDRATGSAESAPGTLYFNFISANRPPLANPRDNAETFNPYLLGILVRLPARVRLGILAVDFVEWEQPKIKPPELNDPNALVQQIISYNLAESP